MSERVVMIDIDDLGIDTVNIRGGEWDYDEELINSIRENGIIDPLIVRPADPSTGKKYAIVCGSRRYNAAIEAGLIDVPCIIKDVDDVTAMGLSIMENKHRMDIPGWRYALKIGEMYEQLDHKGKKEDIIQIIMSKTGFTKTTVRMYLEIAGLPSEIIELMKEPEKRSEKVKELIKAMPGLASEEKTLSVEKAYLIARELREYPLEKKFEVATFILDKSFDVAKELVGMVKSYPRMPMEDIYDMWLGIPKGRRFSLEFSSTLIRALDEACLRKQVDHKTLIISYVEEGLRRDGFL